MRSKLTTTILIALLTAASGPAIATDDGTWHGGGERSTASSPFCEGLGAVAGEDVALICIALFD